ncbi:hypothetical protein GIB67_026135 [Kingdonia uniflora]|uniref:Uncharacterized protein n=1 Tax=Kingdonia uniflora TaxID=39325 RepID=A0A7J7M321_9MAGN|nr:hypothetical protein GIB67_026135 [Kingdonia uniflora]
MLEIIYCDDDLVSFTVEKSNFSFNHICGNHLRDTNEFTPIATHLVPRSSTTEAVQYPVLVLRATLFLDSGICVGQTFNHVTADDPVHDKIVAIFIMDSQSIEKLKKWILRRTIKTNPYFILTSVGVTYAYILLTINKNDIVGEDGIVITAEMIGKAIKTTCNAVLDGAENLLDDFFSATTERLIGIFGSPKMGAYDVNFRWARPKRFEIVLSNEDH